MRITKGYRAGDPVLLQESPEELLPETIGFFNELDFNIFTPLAKEQQAVNEAVEYAFQRKDFAALYDGLDFLKFSPLSAEKIVTIISSAASFLGAVGAVVSAVQTSVKLLEFLGVFRHNDVDLVNLQALQKEINEKWGYLLDIATNETMKNATKLRNDIAIAENKINEVKIAGLGPNAMGDARNTVDVLNGFLTDMLTTEKGNIPFRSASYNGHPLILYLGGTPFLKQADGKDSTAYVEGKPIWDPGHYVDALAAAIRLRIVAGTVLEPLYRSTGYGREELQTHARLLREFINAWRARLLVASPADCMLPDGTIALYDRIKLGGNGILVGAACPVTGISSLQVFSDFPMTSITTSSPWGGLGGKGSRKMKADRPADAMHAALIKHPVLVNRVVRACGLLDLERLQKRLQLLSEAPSPTESIHCDRVRWRGASGGRFRDTTNLLPVHETLDLGKLQRWATQPNKSYEATRYFMTSGKEVTIRLGRRQRYSQIRLGYNLRIGDDVTQLQTWQSAPAPEQAIDWFPDGDKEKTLSFETKLYDCVQNRQLSAAEEEIYDITGDAGTAKRILVNETAGTATVHAHMEFEALAGGDNSAYLGELKLVVRPDDVDTQPKAFVLDITVLETHLKEFEKKTNTGKPIPPVYEEVEVEVVSLHVIPSILVAPDDFFDDYLDALNRLRAAQLASALDVRQRLTFADVPTQVDPRPKFATVRDASFVTLVSSAFDKFEHDPVVAVEVKRHMVWQEPRSD